MSGAARALVGADAHRDELGPYALRPERLDTTLESLPGMIAKVRSA